MAPLLSSPGGKLAMAWVLLLLPPASLKAGYTASCNTRKGFGVIQPGNISGPPGGSVEVPFCFYFPWELASDPKMRIFWRWTHFHGPFIYNSSPPFIHKHFKDRLVLDWKEGETSGVLRILNLREKDESTYFCRVQLQTRDEGIQVWQPINGTHLSVTHAKTTTQSPTSISSANTMAGSEVTKGEKSQEPGPLNLGATVGVAVAAVVLITGILGLVALLKWKRRKGQQTKTDTPAMELSPNTKKYENIGHEGQHPKPKHQPKDDGVVYASLALSKSTSPGAPPCPPAHETPQEETVYSAVKT